MSLPPREAQLLPSGGRGAEASSGPECATWPAPLHRDHHSGDHPHGAGCRGASASFQCTSGPSPVAARLWRGLQAGEKEVPLEGRLSVTLAADDQFDDPAAAGPGLGYEIWSLFGLECPGSLALVTVL